MKEESFVSLYEVNAENLEVVLNSSTGNVPENNDDDSSDDCVIIGSSTGRIVHHPFPSSAEGLMKRSDDIISNDIPFSCSVIG